MQIDGFPEASVAVLVTIVVPRGKKLPVGGTQTNAGEGSQSSLAVTEKNTRAPGAPTFESITMTRGGQVIMGGVVSGPLRKRIQTAPRLVPPSSSWWAPTARS